MLIASTAAWVGENDILLDLLDAEGVRLAPSDPDVTFSLADPDGGNPVPVGHRVVQLAPDARPLFHLRVTLDRSGPWRVSATARTSPGESVGEGFLYVRDDDGTPALGSRVPAVTTPTLASAGGRAETISSMPEPDLWFYERSVAEMLEAGEPFVFVIDSFTFRINEVCGAGLGHAIHLRTEFPELRMIHAEPFRTAFIDGALQFDPPDGPPRRATWSEEWGIREPPWMFVVDRDGRLRAKFYGISGSDELRLAMAAVMEP